MAPTGRSGRAVDNWKDPRGEPILVRSPVAGFGDSRGWGASAAGHHAGTLGGGTRGGGGRDHGGPDWRGPARATSPTCRRFST